MWKPSLLDLENLILKGEFELTDEQLNFWDMIKIEPEKWMGKDYGKEGDGFWVVAIFGREVMWYNDIEGGFNISSYKKYGQIDEYECNQSELNETVVGLLNSLKDNRKGGPYHNLEIV